MSVMSEEQKNDIEEKQEGASCCGCGGHKKSDSSGDESEVFKTFDMYHFFSRKDVIAAIILVVALLLFAVFSGMFVPQPV